MKKFLILLMMPVIIIAISCEKETNNKTAVGVQDSNKTLLVPINTDYLKVVTIKEGDKIKLDSPKKFIQIAILFSHNHKQWLDEVSKNENSKKDPAYAEKYLSKKRAEFFNSFSVSEDSFGSYYSNNEDAVNSFLDKNEDFREAYEASMK